LNKKVKRWIATRPFQLMDWFLFRSLSGVAQRVQ
jgi:hypothetical protein